MAYWGRESLTAAESTLREAGFVVSEPCRSRPSCFDLAARKGESVVFMRVQPDIGSLSTSDSTELKAISESFSAPCLLIGEEAREKPLQDDTVYTRHDILAVTPRTFENVVVHNIRPLIQANPGGYYVEIDGEALKQRRQELGLSAGEVAEMVSTSRRTIYGYERGMAKASVAAAYNLIWALGIPVAKSVNILEKPENQRKSCVLTTARLMLARNRILNKLFGRYVHYHVTAVKRAPFDFVISDPRKRIRIIGGIASRKEPELDARVEEILSVSRVTRARPILITEGQQQLEKDIPCISSEDVSKIKTPEDLIASVR
ncbi:MAG: helix-turn-helix domain-containing protein [Candidatus Bathyarchaeia archaeon]|jgi:putative transcriptional regulator